MTIEVDKDKLTKLIVERCPYTAMTMSGTLWCHKKYDESCHIPFHERDQCPRDCPHLNERVEWACDRDKCAYVKKIIRDLKA